MADHILLEGLGAATLRPLAAAAGTSDRMLLYYFADKDELLTATLARIAARMTAELDDAIPIGPLRSFPELLEEVWTALSSESLKPFMHVWLDLAAGAARGLQPHLDLAGEIAEGFLAWVTSSSGAPKRERAGSIGGAVPHLDRRNVSSEGHWPRRHCGLCDDRACGTLTTTVSMT